MCVCVCVCVWGGGYSYISQHTYARIFFLGSKVRFSIFFFGGGGGGGSEIMIFFGVDSMKFCGYFLGVNTKLDHI